MNHSIACTNLVRSFEGIRTTAYLDQNGVWTNGFGNTQGVDANTPPINMAQATGDLNRNLRSADDVVNRMCAGIELNQNQFDALVSFVFNIGERHFAFSTTLRRLKAGDYFGAADAMLMWDEAAHAVNPGLLRRREAEKAMFLA